MKGRLWFVISLLVIIWVAPMVGCQQQPPTIPELPPGSPIIELHTYAHLAGKARHLTIFIDASIVYIDERGLRHPSPGHEAIRTTRTGQLHEDELRHLLQLVDKCSFDSEGICDARTKKIDTDAHSELSVHYLEMTRTIVADYQPLFHLFRPGGPELSDVPRPVRKLYQELKRIVDEQTIQVSEEKIPCE